MSQPKVTKILFERKYKAGYTYRREMWDSSATGDFGDLEVVACYTPEGDWIGSAKDARFLCVDRGLTKIQKNHSNHVVCSIGFNEEEQKWYGWSHRAICGFGIGDKLFIEKFGNDQTPFVKHGRKTIEKLADAKLAAKRFARSVS